MKGGILGAVCVVVGSAFPTSVHEYTSDDWAPVLLEISIDHPENYLIPLSVKMYLLDQSIPKTMISF